MIILTGELREHSLRDVLLTERTKLDQLRYTAVWFCACSFLFGLVVGLIIGSEWSRP
jgi:hypothetical protein